MDIALEFQKPLWCKEECNDRGYYYLGQLPYLTGTESLIYEVTESNYIILILEVLLVFQSPISKLSIFFPF